MVRKRRAASHLHGPSRGVAVGGGLAVDGVAEDRRAHVCEVNADLVRASRLDNHLHHRTPARTTRAQTHGAVSRRRRPSVATKKKKPFPTSSSSSRETRRRLSAERDMERRGYWPAVAREPAPDKAALTPPRPLRRESERERESETKKGRAFSLAREEEEKHVVRRQRPTTGRDLEFRWCSRLVETGVEASDDGACSEEPRTVRVG